jgi:hypothetical protein
MRFRYKVVVSAALIALLLFAMWLGLHRGVPQHNVSVGVTTSHESTVAWVTNTGRSAITLADHYVQFENAAGQLVRDLGPSWNQEGYSTDLSPGTAAWLATGFDQDTRRLKFVFEYHRNGGPMLSVISKAVSVLPLRRLPPRPYDWLHRHGIVDGAVYGHYESSWIANPQGGANGRQPVRSETNQTPAVAAPRRSP